MTAPQHYTVTPYRSRAELLLLRTALYTPSSPSVLSDALSTVRGWKARGSLPHAIESTALLLEARLFHARWAPLVAADDVCEASFPLRATYTAALARFVTGFADLARHRTGPARSMLDVAREIRLPARFVEMRHEAAHEDLPALGRLVGLAEEALKWLWGVYWSRLEEGEVGEGRGQGGGEVRKEEDVAEECRVRIRGFRKGRTQFLRTRKNDSEEQEGAVVEMATELMAVAEGAKHGYTTLARCLCVQGTLIPTAKTRAEIESRMASAFVLWDGLLQELAVRSRKFMKPFLSTLASTTASHGNLTIEHTGLFTWLRRIATSETWQTILGERWPPLMNHTLKACMLDHTAPIESSEAVCRMLLSVMQKAAVPQVETWRRMYIAKFQHSPDSADEMEG